MLGGMYTQHRNKEGLHSNCIVNASIELDELNSFDGILLEIAVNTPPPRECQSLRYIM